MTGSRFSVKGSQFSILDSRYLILAGIENQELSRESTLATGCELTFERYCTLLLLCKKTHG